MRIVAGTVRGRAITAPAGTDTRPTTDRVREALFSSLFSLRGGFDGACVLDAFAGSGALGLEALSRGARLAVFYERDKRAVAALRRNVEACGFGADRARVVARDVEQAPPTGQVPPFDLVFLDPPYARAAEGVLALPRVLADAGALAPGAYVVYEHALNAREDAERAARAAGFEVVSSRKYGKTAITVMVAAAGDRAPAGGESERA